MLHQYLALVPVLVLNRQHEARMVPLDEHAAAAVTVVPETTSGQVAETQA